MPFSPLPLHYPGAATGHFPLSLACLAAAG
jgi:hypothetical protein